MKIQIIEDDPLLSKTIEFRLRKEGFEVCMSKNGAEAIENYNRINPDLVLTDIMMPVVNGLEVISYIRNKMKSITPIVVLSSAKHQNTVDEALSLGANFFLPKPFTTENLLKTLSNVQSLKAAI
jgi:two-component system, OmpR family, response regulator VicR